MIILIGSSSAPDTGSGITTYCKEMVEEFFRRGFSVFYTSPKPVDATWLEQYCDGFIETSQFVDVSERSINLINFVADNNIEYILNNDNPILQSVASKLDAVFISVAHLSRTNILSLACYNHQYCDYIISICSEMQSIIVNTKKIDTSKVPIVYNGIYDTYIQPENFSSRSSVKKTIIYCGGSIERKGSDLVLQSVLSGGSVWSEYQLHWYGDLSKAYINKLEGLPHVTMFGRVARDRLQLALQNSDIFLLPSRSEGCPMALIEAMSMANACITSDGVGAMDVMVQHGREGYVLNLKQWSDQFHSCLTHFSRTKTLDSMKHLARDKYLQCYTINNTVDNVITLFESVDAKPVSQPVSEPKLLRWHRPLRSDGIKSPMVDRFCIKFGLLRKV
ncbi:hypothetical protein SIN8267_03461 [Sinobacterium norvegicum]|uniref:Glycosyltransferase n=1 Tax=Sinobacterium norvegicum TaxID=1641715 RepID=A0ABN8ELP9_9GAMM|nr:glycosyltransferase family 4 protein [Sinobacterium norvegicum]CAH0993313.1 hypothetical protein SIN8267_03461 [Sinobacterium norvegicum]